MQITTTDHLCFHTAWNVFGRLPYRFILLRAVHRVPRPCPPRQREPQTRVPRTGPHSAAPVDPGGQVIPSRRPCDHPSVCAVAGFRLALCMLRTEGALVTSKRSGVVTRAAIPLTARVCDWIFRLQPGSVFLHCGPRSILTVATACTSGN